MMRENRDEIIVYRGHIQHKAPITNSKWLFVIWTDFNTNFTSQAEGLDENLVYYVCETKHGMIAADSKLTKQLSLHTLLKNSVKFCKIQINWNKLE